MRKWIGKFKTISIQKKMAIAMLVTPVLSSLIILGFYYNYTREFYLEKVAIFQENNRKNMTANVNNILRQIDTVSDQVLGLAVLSSEFENYSEKSTYDRLLLYRKITSQLTNICISNDTIDNIYILDFDGNGFSSNSEWNEEVYKEELAEPLSRDQQGKTVILPPHRAAYRYRGNGDKAPYMVSLLIYLNRYTQSGAIGLIQMDIPYEKIRKSVELLEMTQSDFSFIVDENDYLIYAPDSADIGKKASNVVYGSYNLGGLWEKVNADYKKENNGEQSLLITGIIIVLAVLLGYVLSTVLVKPFARVTKSIEDLTDGYQNEEISVPDYTETALITDAFNKMLSRMKILDESRNEFVSNVSHELKTPLTSMKVLADSLVGQEGVPEELYQEFMGDITAEIDRENKIITDLLSLVKMDKKAADLNVEHLNINQLLEDILKRLRPIADKRHIDLILDSFRPVEADVDEVKFTLAVSNLVENGIKYNVDDGWVRVTLDADHKYFYVKVADSGMGIPEESIGRIFERFYRVDKSHSKEIGGTGLGLAITRSAVTMHHGTIQVASKEGEGTTFTVRIPLSYIP